MARRPAEDGSDAQPENAAPRDDAADPTPHVRLQRNAPELLVRPAPHWLTDILDLVTRWARGRPDVRALALLGSWARGEPREGSDVDLLLLTLTPERYLIDDTWVSALGPARVVARRTWGAVEERRIVFDGYPQVELDLGISLPGWADVHPVDPGTARVVRDGVRILFDPHGLLVALRDHVISR